jgi:hypothetical protein
MDWCDPSRVGHTPPIQLAKKYDPAGVWSWFDATVLKSFYIIVDIV